VLHRMHFRQGPNTTLIFSCSGPALTPGNSQARNLIVFDVLDRKTAAS
jgi:hypothetical protein